jgi:hypothetical protein
MTKFIKTLIIINGIIIPIILIAFLASLLSENARYTDSYKPTPIGLNNTITKDGDTLITQGLLYNTPDNIYNSTNFIIKVHPKNYMSPKIQNSREFNFESGNTAIMMSTDPREYYVNLLFLDSEYKVIGRLVDIKAAIEYITLPSGNEREKTDTTVKNIGYLIAFNDSNNDKVIDWNDKYDLFLSNLDGKNLIQVTRDIDVKSYYFINDHKDIFISFTERKDIPDEHKIIRFSIYNIETNKLKNLTDIDKALNGVQMILNK